MEGSRYTLVTKEISLKTQDEDRKIGRREFILTISAFIGGSFLLSLSVPSLEPAIAAGFKVTLDKEKCNGCGDCVDVCPVDVFEIKGKKAVLVKAKECLGCESCIEVCQKGAITLEEG
jgi:NAD-dependent dihydropyrimidine dehydrogenase PreA subunit